MRAMHEHPVPEESKEEEKTKRCNECDEEFFPIHNFFRLRFLLSPATPEAFIAKRQRDVDLNLLLQGTTLKAFGTGCPDG
jgi:hypothetical protein